MIGHTLTQAERSHVGPDIFDMLQALRPGAPPADRSPTGGNTPVFTPDRILFFVVDDDEIHLFARLVLHGHARLLPALVGQDSIDRNSDWIPHLREYDSC